MHIHPNLNRICVLGYGSQGRAHALNLRDAGHKLVLGLRPGGPTWARAVADGFQPTPVAEAVAGADTVVFLVPDMAQPQVYKEHVEPHLTDGTLLLFAHGFNLHFRRIQPPPTVDVALVAPKAPGSLVREQYAAGRGVPCLLAVAQDFTGTAEARALAYADGIGGTRAGVVNTTFAEETETDLFGEQAVLCGGVTQLVTTAWEVLVEAGYNPEVAYFECLHELKLIVDLLHSGGLQAMHRDVSETASFGDLTRGPRVVDEATRGRMKRVLKEVQAGTFAQEWSQEHALGQTEYQRMLNDRLNHPIEAVGRKLRARMSWLKERGAA